MKKKKQIVGQSYIYLYGWGCIVKILSDIFDITDDVF